MMTKTTLLLGELSSCQGILEHLVGIHTVNIISGYSWLRVEEESGIAESKLRLPIGIVPDEKDAANSWRQWYSFYV